MVSTLLDDAPAKAKKPEPVILKSAHDYALTQRALEANKDELTKLAEKNQKAGYTREARAITADVQAIEHHILPQLRQQRELPLVTHAQLEKEISGALRTFVTRAFDGLGDQKVQRTPEAIADRQNRLITQLATRVTLYVTEVADESFNQGVAAREQTSEGMAMRSITTLRAQGD